MNEYYTDICDQTMFVQRIRKEAESFLASAPEGALHVTGSHGSHQYRVRYEAEKKTVFLRKKDHALAATLAQKEYCRKIVAVTERLERELSAVGRLGAGRSAHFVYEALAGVFLSMPARKAELVHPFVLPDEAFVEQWLNVTVSGPGFKEGAPEIYAERGERVRSKSEKMIADKLFMLGIPYRYESQVTLQNGETVCPDFMILDIAERKEILFEHFGLMSDENYQNRTAWKIDMYGRSGYLPGENFLFTMETAEQPLDMRYFEKIIRNRLRLPAGERPGGWR